MNKIFSGLLGCLFVLLSSVQAQELVVLGDKKGGFSIKALKYSNNVSYGAFSIDSPSPYDCNIGIGVLDSVGSTVSITPINNKCESGTFVRVLDISDSGNVIYTSYHQQFDLEYYYYNRGSGKIDNLFNIPQGPYQGLFLYDNASILKNGNLSIGDKYIEFKNDGSFTVSSLSERFSTPGIFLPTEDGNFLVLAYKNCITESQVNKCQFDLKEFAADGSLLFSEQLGSSVLYSEVNIQYNSFSKITINGLGSLDKFKSPFSHLYTYNPAAKKLVLETTEPSNIAPLGFALGSPNYDKFVTTILPRLISIVRINSGNNNLACLLPQSQGYSYLGTLVGIKSNGDIVMENSRLNAVNIADWYNYNQIPGDPTKSAWSDLVTLRPDYSKPSVDYCIPVNKIVIKSKGRCKYAYPRYAKKYSKITRSNSCELTVTIDSQQLESLYPAKPDLKINYGFFKARRVGANKITFQKNSLLKYRKGKWTSKFNLPLRRLEKRENFAVSLFIGEQKAHAIFGLPYTPFVPVK